MPWSWESSSTGGDCGQGMPVRRSFLAFRPFPAVEKPLTPDQITEAQYQTRKREAAEPREP